MTELATGSEPAVRRGRPPNAETKPEAELAPGHVWCRVTKYGDNKIFTGETDVTIRGHDDFVEGHEIFPRHRTGEIIHLPKRIAMAQEDLGNLEIQED